MRASDFEHEIERVLSLRSPGAPFFEGIAGARAYMRARDRGGDISGITADDETGEITIRLDPSGRDVLQRARARLRRPRARADSVP